jgi:hypothetical protein
MIQKIAASAVLGLALAGCAILQPEEKLAPQPAAQGVELTKEQGGRFIAFVGPKLQHTEMFLGVAETNYFALRSWFDNKTGETAHQLYVEDSYYGGPYKWDGVHDKDNKPLRFVAISRNEITCDQGCAYADEFAAALPEDYLRAQRSGLSVVFTASDGKTLTVTVPPNLVAAELTAVDAVRAIAAKTASTSTAAPTPAAAAASAPTASPPAASPAPALPPGTVVPAPSSR